MKRAGGRNLPSGALSVAEVVRGADDLLRSAFTGVRVGGELSRVGFSGGHCYFSIKDASAVLAGVMWASNFERLRFQPEVGMEVLVGGTLGVYSRSGQFQIQATVMEPLGVGALAVAFEQLKRKLAAAGLFDPQRKRRLPAVPRVVGVVMSRDSAALQDVLRVLASRHSGVHVVVAHARVQGEGSAIEIARGIRMLNEWGRAEVIIVGRGGGSPEDLWAFNEEPVVRAIAKSDIPVISAVGHETDTTLADLAADVRAPTPSAAAERVVLSRVELERRVRVASDRLIRGQETRVAGARRDWQRLVGSVALAGYPARLRSRRLEFGRELQRLARAPEQVAQRLGRRHRAVVIALRRWPATLALAARGERVATDVERLLGGARAHQAAARGRLATLAARLQALSPLAVLGRGYAIVFSEPSSGSARVVSREDQVMPGESVRIRLAEGELQAMVTRRGNDRRPENRSLFEDSES